MHICVYMCLYVCASCSVVSDSLRHHGLQPSRLLSPWDFSGKNTGVGSHSPLQGIFLTQRSNPGLQHCGQTLYHLGHEASPIYVHIYIYKIQIHYVLYICIYIYTHTHTHTHTYKKNLYRNLKNVNSGSLGHKLQILLLFSFLDFSEFFYGNMYFFYSKNTFSKISLSIFFSLIPSATV